MRLSPRIHAPGVALLVAVSLMLISSLAQASPWDREARDCRVQLAKGADTERMGHCMLLWVTYSSQQGLSAKDRRTFAGAFNQLHQASATIF